MKIKFKQVQSRLKKKYHENRYFLTKRISKKWDSFLQKGHEKMTIMFIPHNEKSIFNFQISKFTMHFFLVLFIIVLVSSSYAIYRNPAIQKDRMDKLIQTRGIHSELIHFEKLTYEVADIIDDIKPEIENLYRLAGGKEDFQDFWNIDHLSKKINNPESQASTTLPEEIYELQKLQNDIINATNTIKTIANFVEIRYQVISETPSSIPNRGHITSLFGWRRSPFGFGRDFHSGIDIAAPHGTPIHATAPGKVVMAGWGGGYGNMVRIQHKYGFQTIFGHCSSLNVKTGDFVRKGQTVGFVGQTGSSTGDHCHYEIRLGNIPINPYPYMSNK